MIEGADRQYIIRKRWDEDRVFAERRRNHWFIFGSNEHFYGTPVEVEKVELEFDTP